MIGVGRIVVILVSLALLGRPAFAQVDEIKQASSKASKSKASDGGSSDSDSGHGIIHTILFFIPEWQKYKLHPDNRQRYPSMVSLDMYAQGGYKDKAYMFWPRIRGNWGLFSTDFRANYLFEKDDTGGYKTLHTNDWQVLQLNITTSRLLTFRVGLGTMTEAFGDFNQYTEFTAGFGIHAPDQTNVFYAEYRDAYRSGLDVKARIEFSAQYQHQIFKAGSFKGYLTGGVVYQKHYGTIDFWGVQAGLLFRVFRDVERF
jgi:hypothetical protein